MRLWHTNGVMIANNRVTRCAALSLPPILFAAGLCHAIGEDQQPSSSAWDLLRAKYYGERPMGVVDETFMSVEVPANTPDPAATPLTLRFADDAHRRIKRVRVFIDNNPSPLVATFDLPGTPVTEIDMRVRIDRFTSVRAIAEMADGGLEMRSSWVKASGGCSAPSAASGEGMLGEVRVRTSPDAKSMQVAHYITHIRVNTGGTALLDADTGISLSENPSLRIVSDQPLALPVSVDAVDSETQAHYTASNGSR